MDDNDIVIDVQDLQVDFDNVTAVIGTSFQVRRGQVFGLIGPNGAGKTTTLRVLATLQEPTLGRVTIAGHRLDGENRAIRRLIGFMPDFPPVYEELKVWEFLDLYAGAYDLAFEKHKRRCNEELKRVGLVEKHNAFIGELSRGMKQRLILAKTLLPSPEILLLDEPASGLDPLARKELSDILNKLRGEGRTIVVSSHILTEMSEFCTSMGIMEKGRIFSAGTIEELGGGAGALRLAVRFLRTAPEIDEKIKQFPAVTGVQYIKDNRWEVTLKGDESIMADYLKYLVTAGLPVVEVSQIKADVRDIFFRSGAHNVS